MASKPRYAIIEDNSIFHVTWQCHNKEWHFKHDWAKKLYYDLLLKYKDKYDITIFSFTFMDNHSHLSGFCKDKYKFSEFFRVVHSIFAKTYNKRMDRKGQLFMDRFKSPRIETEKVLFKVMSYIDLNPKRACMVKHPKDYKWSSFKHYAYGEKDPLITEPECYKQLGATPQQRQKAYLAMIEDILQDDWKQKRPYSSVSFIGNPAWVKAKHEALKKLMREKREKNKPNKKPSQAPPKKIA